MGFADDDELTFDGRADDPVGLIRSDIEPTDGTCDCVARRDDISQKDDECKAYAVGITCLKNEANKCNKLKGKQKADCQVEFFFGINAMKSAANNNFGCGIK